MTDTHPDPAVLPAEPPPLPTEEEIVEEHGGPKGPEPTRYGDWEADGICRDF